MKIAMKFFITFFVCFIFNSVNVFASDYEDGIAFKKSNDLKRAASSFLSSAKSGDSRAMFELGNLMLEGRGIEQNIPEAMNWYLKSAENGNTDSITKIGLIYREGKHVKSDIDYGNSLIHKAANEGNTWAKVLRIKFALEGEKTHPDDIKIVCDSIYADPFKFFTFNLTNKTMNGFDAQISENKIDWREVDIAFSLDRYSGKLMLGKIGKEPFDVGTCVKRAEIKF